MEMMLEQALKETERGRSRQVVTLQCAFFYRPAQAQRSDTLPGTQEEEGKGW